MSPTKYVVRRFLNQSVLFVGSRIKSGREFEAIGNESVPIKMAQCPFPGLAISNDRIVIYFSNKIHGSNFIKQHSETMV